MTIATLRSARPSALRLGAARIAINMRTRRTKRLRAAALMPALWMAVVLMLTPLPGWASNLYSWSGASSALWSNPANWTPNGVPTDGDTLAFPSGAANITNTNDLAAGTTFVSLVFNGNSYTLNGNAIVLTSSISATVGTTTVNLPINVSNNAVTFDAYDLVLGGSLSGSGPITTSYTSGYGVHIAASGSYSGTITANGHLWFNAVSLPIAAIASGAILHLDGASLPTTAVTHTGGAYAFNGYGTIGALTATGAVFPGDNYLCGNATAGQINTGNLSLNGQGCFAMNGAAAGTGYSQLNVAGTVSLGAGSTLNVSLSPSYVPAQGQSFVLIKNDGADAVSGTFNGLPGGSVITLNSVYQFSVSYVGGSGNDVVLTCTVAPHAWTGATNALWSNANNWNPATVPQAGDTLLFPSGAANITNTNDLAAFTSFPSLVISGGGYTLNGNAIVLTSSIVATTGTTTVNLPINVSNNAVTFDGYDLVLGGSLSGTGPITTNFTGGYGVRIAASGSYSGSITANGHLRFDAVSLPVAAIASNAILQLNGASLPATSVTHSGGSYALNGFGTIGALTATGPVFPGLNYLCGSATASQINTSNLSLSGQGCFALNGAAAGTGYSQLNVAGSVTLGASSSLNVSLSPSFIPAQGQSFVLINNDGADAISGTFNGLPEGSVITLNSVYQFTVSYVGGSGNDVVLTCTVAPHAWTGATNALWSNANNWNPATVPQAGDTLLFPSGAANITNTNDLAAFTSFPSLVVSGSGYTLNGNAIVLTSSIVATTGTTTVNLPINVSNNAVTFDAYDLVLGGSLSGTGPITTSFTGGYGVRIAASGSYSGAIIANGHLRFDAVSLPVAAIASNGILRFDGASLPATSVMHSGGGYALNGFGTIGALTATGSVFPGLNYLCGSATASQINTANLSLSGQGCFALNGAAAGTGYSQLNVAGSVTLGATSSLNVSLSPSFIPAQGQSFVLINNDGADAVSGTFNGLPEGSLVTLNTVYQFTLSYVGGSGNDVVLTSLNGLPLPSVTLISSVNPSTPGQNVMFTATVSGSGPVPTGTVTFFDGFSTLASAPLNGSGVATYSTTALSVGTHSIVAQYNSDSNYGGNVSPALAQVVGQASQFLTFNPPPIVTIGGTSTVLATSANPNSGNAIQYSTLSPDCSVNASSGLVNGLLVGTNNCTITATQAGNANYLVGTATQILSISKVTSTLSLGSTCMRTFVESQPFTFTATVTGLSPSGTVAFDDGNFQTLCSSVPLSGGTATCTTSMLDSASPTTTYSLGASYSGDGNNTTSLASAPLVITVLDTAEVVFRDGFEPVSLQCPVE
ncbi:MAG: Ig-like domain repeat protein [Dokdonella sp.]